MAKFLLCLWLLFPSALTTEYIAPRIVGIQAFEQLLVTCLNGGRASIWNHEHKPIAYIECKRIAFPPKFPR